MLSPDIQFPQTIDICSSKSYMEIINNLAQPYQPCNFIILPPFAHKTLNPSRNAWQHFKDCYPEYKKAAICEILTQQGFPIAKLEVPAAQLSGGQAQLLALLLILNTRKKAVFLIEPYVSLSKQVIDSVKALIQYTCQAHLHIYILTSNRKERLTSPSHLSSHPVLAINHLSVTYQAKVLCNLSLTLHRGEVLGIVGENGSGKSTLASAIMQSLPYEGEVILDGEVVNKNRLYQKQLMGFLPQKLPFNPLIKMGTILEEPFNHAIFNKSLNAFNITSNWEEHYPDELPHPMLLSIAIARLLAREPRVLILDEPFAAIDDGFVDSMMKLINQYHISTILIEHQMRYIHTYCHRVLSMQDGRLYAFA